MHTAVSFLISLCVFTPQAATHCPRRRSCTPLPNHVSQAVRVSLAKPACRPSSFKREIYRHWTSDLGPSPWCSDLMIMTEKRAGFGFGRRTSCRRNVDRSASITFKSIHQFTSSVSMWPRSLNGALPFGVLDLDYINLARSWRTCSIFSFLRLRAGVVSISRDQVHMRYTHGHMA